MVEGWRLGPRQGIHHDKLVSTRYRAPVTESSIVQPLDVVDHIDRGGLVLPAQFGGAAIIGERALRLRSGRQGQDEQEQAKAPAPPRYNPFSAPQIDTSRPISRNIAAFTASARFAPAASGAYATCT